MTMPSSGPLNMGGTSTPVSVAQELGLGLTTTISMNQTNVRTLAGVSTTSGTSWSMNSLYGKSNRVTASATISANTQNYVVNTAKASGYAAGRTDFTLTINSGIYVGASTTGGIALDVDTSWSAGDTITIVNNGFIVGAGGAGGGGGGGTSPSIPGAAGGAGGAALRAQRAVTINNVNVIGGGGGGGGGGTSAYFPISKTQTGSGGGGGGGGGQGYSGGGAGGGGAGYYYDASSGIWAAGPGFNGAAGGAGTTTGPGGGGGGYSPATAGGAGASYGAASSGAGGACTTTGSNANITWTATGTRYGTIG